MAKIVTIVNQKGGVGKTTTCVNLTAALREKDLRVLLCDFDPQANATSGMGVDKTLSQGIYDVLINSVMGLCGEAGEAIDFALIFCRGLRR